ncbi:hypothetical protein [Streptomyces yaizuensis]|uniref:Secreted protein n=1 Tax=Streptomyces yaizuensis TaxID=2989713 RepID=A0ABQ5NXZ8_9ACTN|nr:hypothetical protein [Streptomyces sp. YSPA8]GLF95233.1 hypothetical protein SYYSPA8_13070 [Streptomyces sp. YSPA8]
MSAFRRSVVSVLSSVVLAGGLAVGAAGPASAAGCPSSASPVINGASAHWSLRCANGKLLVSGWVQDTSMDGKCAKVRIHPNEGLPKFPTACSSGVRQSFSYEFPGAERADVRLAVA